MRRLVRIYIFTAVSITVFALSGPSLGSGETPVGEAAPDTALPTQSPSSGKRLPPIAPDQKTTISEVGVLCPTADEQALEFYNKALLLQQQGQFDQAIESNKKAIETDPGYCDAMDNLGLLFRMEGDIKQAILWYQRSLNVKPDNPAAHQNLAVAYRIQGDADKAIGEYRWLVQKNRNNPEGYYGLGMTYLQQGSAREAIEPLLHAEELYRASSSPLLIDAEYLLGVAYFVEKDYRKAAEYLEPVQTGREEDAELDYMLGVCYSSAPIKNIAKAKEYMLKAKKLGWKIPAELLRSLGI